MGNFIQNKLGSRFRRIITNTPDGNPPWLAQVAEGNGVGLFSPQDAPWIVHGDLATLIGGIRALLVQALHPGSLAGVADHSRYEQDPLGRLAGTTKWLTVTTFGSLEAIAHEAKRVNAMHTKVTGTFVDANGELSEYRAQNIDLLLWVHSAFTDSFLATHLAYSKKPIPGGADAYVALWSKSVEPLGLSKCPMSYAQLQDTFNQFSDSGKLTVTDKTLSVIGFIKHPPLSRAARIVYALLFQAALVTLPKHFQDQLQLRPWPQRIVKPATRLLLRLMQLAIGKSSPLEDAARERLSRATSPTLN